MSYSRSLGAVTKVSASAPAAVTTAATPAVSIARSSGSGFMLLALAGVGGAAYLAYRHFKRKP